jgi:hypothetical protein
MKRLFVALTVALALALPLSCLAAGVTANPISVGNHTDYGGGGGGTTGGGTTYTTGGGNYGVSSSGSGSSSPASIIIILVIIGVVLVLDRKRKSQRVTRTVSSNFVPLSPESQDQITEQIREHDPNFDPESFISWSKQVFIQLQQAWEERDWKKARPFESEELFNQHKAQLDEYINNHTINMMENVCVNEAYFEDYSTQDKYEYLTVFMQTSYYDYIIDEQTKKVVRGDPQRRYDVNYRARFMRTLGVTTGQNSNASTTKCPNCGAPVDVNAAGECAYCGTVITNGDHDWVLCNLDDVR